MRTWNDVGMRRAGRAGERRGTDPPAVRVLGTLDPPQSQGTVADREHSIAASYRSSGRSVRKTSTRSSPSWLSITIENVSLSTRL